MSKTKPATKTFYRYEDVTYGGFDEFDNPTPGRTVLELREYPLLKETAKGNWIGWDHWKKWVSNSARKRFAYPTKEEALTSFIFRAKARIRIYTARLETARYALSLAEAKQRKEGAPVSMPSPYVFY